VHQCVSYKNVARKCSGLILQLPDPHDKRIQQANMDAQFNAVFSEFKINNSEMSGVHVSKKHG